MLFNHFRIDDRFGSGVRMVASVEKPVAAEAGSGLFDGTQTVSDA